MSKFSTWLNSLLADGSPDTAADYLVSYDASAATSKKVLMDTLISGAGGITQAGWVGAGETWVYASADDPTFTFTIAGVDLTAKYSAGMRIKLTQTTVKYFIITKVVFSIDTTITIYGGTDYDLANAAITDPFYSVVKAPAGFPLDPLKWTVTTNDTTSRTQATPVNGTWYNLGGVNIIIPIGAWLVSYQVLHRVTDTTAGFWNVWTTLSTANNSASDADFTTLTLAGAASSDIGAILFREKHLNLASKTTYYINTEVTTANADNIWNRNDLSPCILKAVCAYL